MSPGRYYNQSVEQTNDRPADLVGVDVQHGDRPADLAKAEQPNDRLAGLVGAFKAKYMFSDDTHEKYKACQAYIAGQRNEFNALNAELARHMQDCIEARNSTASGISQIIFGILATGIILGKFPLYENLMASIPVFIHILWNICRMTSWYADHINIPFATVEFCLGSCLIYTIHIWPTGGKVMGCLMYLIFMIQIAAIFNCFNKIMRR